MGFLAPLFAGLVVLAGVPVLVHLYGRPRAVKRRFAAIELLLRSDRKTAVQRRLRELLLLCARAVAIAAVPLILAKPYFETASDLPTGVGVSESAVFVLDDSRSMGYSDGGSDRFEAARKRALQIVDALGPSSDAAVILCSPGAESPQSELTSDRDRLRQAIARAHVTHRPGDISAALRRAAAILSGSPRSVRRVYLLSDLAAHGFETEAAWGAGGPTLVPIDVAAGGSRANRAVLSLHIDSAQELGPRGIAVDAVIANFGGEALTAQALTLRVDGKAVAKSLVDLPAHERVTKRFFHSFDTGSSTADGNRGAAARGTQAHTAEVELSPDALTDDDRRYAHIEERRDLRVLLIDGDPRTVRRDDELFYLETALRPGDRAESRIGLQVTTLDELTRLRLDDYDVVFAANVKAPDHERAAALDEFVRRGGGLFLSVGENVDPDAWNAALGPLLPQPLATLRSVGAVLHGRDDGEAHNGGEGERVARFDRSHPLLALFEGGAPANISKPGPASPPTAPATADPKSKVSEPATGSSSELHGPAQAIREARVGRYALLRPTPQAWLQAGDATGGGTAKAERRVLLRLESGAPLLVEGGLGKGRVFLLTTTIDRDWSDLAIQPAYLPLMQQAARYLARAPLEEAEAASLVGQPREIPLRDGDTRMELTLPSGVTRMYDEERVGGRKSIRYADTFEPGAYRVSLGTDGETPEPRAEAGFAVNVDAVESDLTPIAPAKLASLSHPDPGGSGRPPRKRVELWHALGAALLLLLLVEGLLTLR